MNRFFSFLLVSFLASQNTVQYIDGVAAIIEDHIVLKSELAQMVNMAAIQNRVDPNKNPDDFVRLQNTIVQSMIDQKIMRQIVPEKNAKDGKKRKYLKEELLVL